MGVAAHFLQAESNILPIENHPAFIRIQKSHDMLEKHRFTAAGLSDNHDRLAAIYFKIDTVQNGLAVEALT